MSVYDWAARLEANKRIHFLSRIWWISTPGPENLISLYIRKLRAGECFFETLRYEKIIQRRREDNWEFQRRREKEDNAYAKSTEKIQRRREDNWKSYADAKKTAPLCLRYENVYSIVFRHCSGCQKCFISKRNWNFHFMKVVQASIS